MQAERKRQAGALLETLKELCAALEIRPDSVEQRSCISLMESAACVHITSLEKACTQTRPWPVTIRPVNAQVWVDNLNSWRTSPHAVRACRVVHAAELAQCPT